MPAPPSPLPRQRPWDLTSEGAGPQRGITTVIFGQVPGVADTSVDSNGTSGALDVTGTNGAMTIEAWNRGTGAISLNIQHTMDAANVAGPSSPWEDQRMNPLGTGGFITPVVGPIVINPNSVQGFALLDSYPTLQFITSSAAAGALLQVRAYLVPQ